jgi:hypothetical protein
MLPRVHDERYASFERGFSSWRQALRRCSDLSPGRARGSRDGAKTKETAAGLFCRFLPSSLSLITGLNPWGRAIPVLPGCEPSREQTIPAEKFVPRRFGVILWRGNP